MDEVKIETIQNLSTDIIEKLKDGGYSTIDFQTDVSKIPTKLNFTMEENNIFFRAIFFKQQGLSAQKDARLNLFHSAVHTKQNGTQITRSMEEINEMILASNFVDLPENFLSTYKSTSACCWWSPNYSGSVAASSVTVPHEKGKLELSRLNFGCIHEQQTLGICITDQLSVLETSLCNYLFGGNMPVFNKFMDEEIKTLSNIQKLLLAKAKDDVLSIGEVEYLQPLVTVMEDDCIDRIQNNDAFPIDKRVQIAAAHDVPFETNVTVTTTEKNLKSVLLKGFTDIVVRDETNKEVRIQELKQPCVKDRLYKCSAWRCKSQLCGQLLCLGVRNDNIDILVGGLLDLFAICIAIRIPPKDGQYAKYYVSERVTDPRAYILVMIFNLFGLPKADILNLTTTGTTADTESVFEEAEYNEDEEFEGTDLNEKFDKTLNIKGDISTSEHIVAPVAKHSKKKNKKKVKYTDAPKNDIRVYRDDDHDDDEKDTRAPPQTRAKLQGRALGASMSTRSHTSTTKENRDTKSRQVDSYSSLENYQEKVGELLEWDRRRQGFATLTESELNKRNSTASINMYFM